MNTPDLPWDSLSEPSLSDSLLFFELASKTEAVLGLWCELDQGGWKHFSEEQVTRIKDVLDTPELRTVLLRALEDIEGDLKLAAAIASDDAKFLDRIKSIRGEK